MQPRTEELSCWTRVLLHLPLIFAAGTVGRMSTLAKQSAGRQDSARSCTEWRSTPQPSGLASAGGGPSAVAGARLQGSAD